MLDGHNFSVNEAVKSLLGNEMGVVLVSESDFLYTLASHITFEDRQVMCGDEASATYHLFPLLYSSRSEPTPDIPDLVHSRQKAIFTLFYRWDALGYNKRHAKSPFTSKAFITFLDEMNYYEAEYMLATA